MNFNSNKKGKNVHEDFLSRLPALSKRISKEKMNEDSAKSPTNAVAPPISIAQSHSDKDFNFTMKLSQNLIVQTRKLQADNKKKDIKIVDLNKKISQLTTSVSSLQSKVTELSSAEQQLDETNWELNLNYQENLSSLNKTKDSNAKLLKDLAAITHTNNELSQEVEELRLKFKNINDTYSNHKATTEARIHELESQMDELNTENNDLSNKISGLQDELTSPVSREFKSPRTSMNAANVKIFNSNKFDPSTYDFSVDTEAKNLESKTSQIDGLTSRNIHLESQTLKSNLDHAHHVIAKLRSQLLKYRKEDLSGSSIVTDTKKKDSKDGNNDPDCKSKAYKPEAYVAMQKKNKLSLKNDTKNLKILSRASKDSSIRIIDHETDKLLEDTENWLDYKSDDESDVNSEVDEVLELENNEFDNFGIDNSDGDIVDVPVIRSLESSFVDTGSISSLPDIEDEKAIVDRYVKRHKLKLIPMVNDNVTNSDTYMNLAKELETNTKSLDDEMFELTSCSDAEYSLSQSKLSSELELVKNEKTLKSQIEELTNKLKENEVNKDNVNSIVGRLNLIAVDSKEFEASQKLVDQLKVDNNLLNKELAVLKENLKLAESNSSEKSNIVEDAKAELKLLQNKLSIADSLAGELSAEVASLKSSNVKSEAEIISLTKITTSLRSEIQDLKFNIDNLKFKNNSTEKSFNELSEKHATLRSEYDSIKKDLETSNAFADELSIKHADIKAKHDELQTSHKDISTKLNEATEELQNLKFKHDELTNSHKNIHSELESKNKELTGMNDTLASLNDINLSKDVELASLRSKHNDYESTIAKFKTSLDSIEAAYNELKCEHQSLQESHEQLKNSHDKLKNTHNDLAASNNSLEATVRDMNASHKSKIDSLINEISEAELQYKSLKGTLEGELLEKAKLSDMLEQKVKDLGVQSASSVTYKQKIAELEEKLSESENARDDISEKTKQLQLLNEELHSKFGILQKEYDQVNSDLESLRGFHDDVKNKNIINSTKLVELGAAHEALKVKNKELENKILNLESENKSASESHISALKKADLKRKSLESKITDLSSHLSNLTAEHQELSRGYENSKKEVTEHVGSIKTLSDKIAEFTESEKLKTSKLASLTASYEELNKTHQNISNVHKEMQDSHNDEIHTWKSKFDNLEKQYKESTKQISELGSSKKLLQESIHNKESEITNLKASLEESTAVVTNYQSRISDLEKSMATAVATRESLSILNKELKERSEKIETEASKESKCFSEKLGKLESKIKDLVEEKESLMNEVKSLNEALENLKKDREVLEQSKSSIVADYMSKIKHLSDKVQSHEETNTSLDEHLKKQAAELKTHIENNDSLLKDTSAFKLQIEQLTCQNSMVSEELMTEKIKLEEHVEDKRKLVAELEKFRLELIQSKECHKLVSTELEKHKCELNDHINKNAELDLLLKSHKESLDKKVAHNKSLLTDINTHKQNLAARIVENESLSAKNEVYEKKLAEISSKHESLTNEFEISTKALDLQKNKHEELISLLEAKQSELDIAIIAEKNISEKNSLNSKKLAEVTLLLEDLKSEHSNLRDKHDIANSDIESLRLEICAVKADKELLIKEKETLLSEMTSLKKFNESKLKKLNATLDDLTLKFETEVESKELLSKNHKSVTDLYEKNMRELESANKSIQSLNKEKDTLHEKVTDFHKKHLEVSDLLASTVSKHDDLETVNAKLSDSNKLLKSSNIELESKLEEYSKKDTEMNHKVRNMEDVICQLKDEVSHFTKEHELNQQKVKDLEQLRSETGDTVEVMSKKLVDLEASYNLLLSDKEAIEKQRATLKDDHELLISKHEKLEANHVKITSGHSKLVDAHGELNKSLDDKLKHIEDLTQKVNELESKHSSMSDDYNTLQTLHHDVESRLQSKTDEHEKLNAVLNDKEKESADKDLQIESFKRKIDELSVDVKKHLDIIESKDKQIESIDVVGKENKIKELTTKIELSSLNHQKGLTEKDAEIKELKAQHDEISNQLSLKSREFLDLCAVHDTKVKDLDQIISELNSITEKYESVSKDNEDYSLNIQKLSAENDLIQKKLSERVAEIESLTSTHKETKMQLAEASEAYNIANTRLESTIASVSQLQENLDKLNKSLELTEKESQSKDEQLKTVSKRVSELESSIESKTNHIKSLKSSHETVSNQLDDLKKQHSEVLTKHGSMNDHYKSKSAELDIQNEKYDQLSKANLSLQEELSSVKTQHEKTAELLKETLASMTTLQEAKGKLDDSVKYVQGEYDNVNKILEDYKVQLGETREKFKLKEELIETLKTQIESHEAEKATLTETVKGHIDEINVHKKSLGELSKEIEDKQAFLNILTDRYENTKSSVDDINKDIAQKEALLVELQAENTKLEELMKQEKVEKEKLLTDKELMAESSKRTEESLRKEIMTLTSELIDLKSSHSSITKEFLELKSQVDDHKKYYNEASANADSLNERISSLNEKVGELTSKLSKSDEENKFLKDQVESLTDEKNLAVATSNEDIASLKKSINNLETDNRALRSNKSSDATTLLEITASLDALKHAHTELTSKYDSLTESHKSLSGKNIQDESKHKELEKSLSELDEKHSKSKELAATLKAENDKLNNQLATLEHTKNDVEKRFADITNEKKSLSIQLQELQEESDLDKKQIAEFEAETTKLTQSNSELTKQVEELHRKIDDLINDKSDLSSKIEQLNNSVNKERADLTGERDSLEFTIKDLNSRITAHETSNKTLEENYKSALSKIEQLSANISALEVLKSENEKLSKANEKHISEKSLLQKDIKKYGEDSSKLAAMAEELRVLSLENTGLVNSLKSLKGEHGTLKSDYQNKVLEIESINKEFDAKISALKTQNTKVQLDYDKTFADYNSLFNEHKNLNKLFKELSTEHIDVKRIADSLKNDLEEINKQHAAVTLHNCAIENELKEQVAAAHKLQVDHSEVSKKHDELAESLDVYKKEIVHLNEERDQVPTIEDLRQKAKALNFVLVSNDKYSTLIANNNVSKDSLAELAKDMNLLVIPETSYIATNMFKTPDTNNVIVLPKTYYNKLSKNDSLALYKVGLEKIKEEAEKRGFNLLPLNKQQDEVEYDDTNDELASLRNGNNNNVNVNRHNARNSIRSVTGRTKLDPSQQVASTNVSPKHVSKRPSTSQFTYRSTTSNRNSTADASVAMISLATEASMNEPSIIAAVAQTVIGEFLHKYYRRLGPLSVMSETRHERYFWVHPYTMTLYWSTENPVQGNPSEDKTRAAAIIGVESVDDNNPIPTGLYHKSIIVHTNDKDVKITCPSRIRHNIWYNSLKYLIHRNAEGLGFS